MSIRTILLAGAALSVPLQARCDYIETHSGSTGGTAPLVFTFTSTPAPISDATLTLVATGGELSFGGNKRLESLTVDGVTYTTPGFGLTPGYLLPTTQPQQFYTGSPTLLPPPVTIPLADLLGYTADGQIVVSIVKPNFISGASFDLTLSYVPEPSALTLLPFGGTAFLIRRRRTFSACTN